MAEKIIGEMFLLNEDGDALRVIEVLAGAYEVIGGTFGSLVVDMMSDPPKIQGKGNVWVWKNSAMARTVRVNMGESLRVYMSADGQNGNDIGFVEYK